MLEERQLRRQLKNGAKAQDVVTLDVPRQRMWWEKVLLFVREGRLFLGNFGGFCEAMKFAFCLCDFLGNHFLTPKDWFDDMHPPKIVKLRRHEGQFTTGEQ